MHILVIDDEPAIRQVMVQTLARAGHAVDQAGGAKEAATRLATGDVDVALCDIQMPDGSGIDLVRSCRAAGDDTTFVMVTAFGSVETAVEALQAGAADYITKPVRGDELLHRLRQIEQMRGLREENRVLRRVAVEHAPKPFRFQSPNMLAVEKLAMRVAPTPSTVLVTGESGTGKGVLARTIHDASPRAGAVFRPVNCSAIPEQMLEAEFFGHTKGAFTGATTARKGLFLEADRGTLFLDEIGELPLHMQTKLLHAIEEKDVRPVGADASRRVDTRIVAATNRDLAQMVREGRFREDLYFRLAMFHIALPPLRERTADLPGLIRFALDGLCRSSGRGGTVGVSPEAEEALVAWRWPGNVRELENVLNRAYILADGDCITLADLPPEITRDLPGDTPTGMGVARSEMLRDQMRLVEAGLIQRALAEANDDRRAAARKLGIGLSSLYRKLEEFERQGIIKPA